MDAVERRQQLFGVRFAHRPHQIRCGGRHPGAVAERAGGQREGKRHLACGGGQGFGEQVRQVRDARPRRRHARRTWRAPRWRRSPTPASMTIAQTSGSTWSSTLSTHGAPTNSAGSPGRPAGVRGACHRVTADEVGQQADGLHLVEHGGLDAGHVGQRAVRRDDRGRAPARSAGRARARP